MSLREFDLRNTSEYLEFVNMYRSYIEELSTFTDRLDNFPLYDETTSIWQYSSIQKYFVINDDKIVGFLLIGIEDNKHPDSDWYIEEFYIKKEYQNKGIGTAAIKELLETKKGRYCLFVLWRNLRAAHFWQGVFTDSGYINVSQNHVDIAPLEDCEFRMYEAISFE